MAVSHKAMTEGIRTPITPGALDRRGFYNPSVSRLRETREPAPFTQGSRRCRKKPEEFRCFLLGKAV